MGSEQEGITKESWETEDNGLFHGILIVAVISQTYTYAKTQSI
jgi:hypothetical protein